MNANTLHAETTRAFAEHAATTAAAREASHSGLVPSGRTRLRLTRRGRIVLTSLAAAPLVAGAFLFAVSSGGALASAETSSVDFEYVTVHAGESLWALAEDIAPSADARDVIAEIVSLNQLETAELEPGQQLAIPLAYSR